TKTLAMDAAAASEHALLAHISERDGGEIKVYLIAKLFPEIVRGAAGPIAAAPDWRAGGTACRTDRLGGGKKDVGDAGLAAGMGEKIAAPWAAHALDESAFAQHREELFKIRQRDLLPLGDLGKRNWSASAVLCEVDHRHHGIAALGAQPHRSALRLRASYHRPRCHVPPAPVHRRRPAPAASSPV